jgi:hypothetical protein
MGRGSEIQRHDIATSLPAFPGTGSVRTLRCICYPMPAAAFSLGGGDARPLRQRSGQAKPPELSPVRAWREQALPFRPARFRSARPDRRALLPFQSPCTVNSLAHERERRFALYGDLVRFDKGPLVMSSRPTFLFGLTFLDRLYQQLTGLALGARPTKPRSRPRFSELGIWRMQGVQ